MKRWIQLLLAAGLGASSAFADAGVLIPSTGPQPDPKVLSIEEMSIDIRIDNGVAKVAIRQIFASHVDRVLEGNWIFALPGRATVSDFAVWDGVTRIPGVILERRRAEEIYQSLRVQMIDPGLLQQGQAGAGEARRTAVFSARVTPIPGYGFKRIEIEYHERIPVENLQSYFAIPLRPDAYQAQIAGQLAVRLEVLSKHPIRDFEGVGTAYPLEVTERTPNRIRARFDGAGVHFAEDLAFRYDLDAAGGDSLEILTYRNPKPAAPNPATVSPEPEQPEPGFFQASVLLAKPGSERQQRDDGMGPPAPAGTRAPRTMVLLFDTSLSMQWEKLERSYQALETLLHSLGSADRFNLLLFNTRVSPFSEAPVPADRVSIQKALDFVRSSRLRGGTDLQQALAGSLEQAAAGDGERYIILLGDGSATRGTIHTGRLAQWYESQLAPIPAARRPRTYVFGVGDDANLRLLRMLGGADGVVEWVRSTEPIEFKLNAFVSKIGRRPVADLRLSATPESVFDFIYPLEKSWFAGSVASWVGRYPKPGTEARFQVSGVRGGEPLEMLAAVSLPEQDTAHPHLPRTWARARVDALLEKIERDGEDQTTIDEIIRLARKYKFVTPYTSFLAAPRSLLRPRAIRPGDPVLRVRTDESVVSVTALFPFGLIKKLKYLGGEDIWQTRFLAPVTMEDGEHEVRLIMRDRQGRAFREKKSFVITSKPPTVRVHLEKQRYRQGEAVELRVSATQTTRTLVARMYGVAPVHLRWNPAERYNTGELVIPADLPAGQYPLTVTAEDFAHNIGTGEVTLEVVP